MWPEMKENEGLGGLRRHACHAFFWTGVCASTSAARNRFDCPDDAQVAGMRLRIGIQFSYHSSTIPMRFFRELDPFASHVAVAALAIATWVFLIVPLWRRWRPRLLLLSKNNLLKKRLAAATIGTSRVCSGLVDGVAQGCNIRSPVALA